MKNIAKYIVVMVLGWQVRRLRRKHTFKVIAVAGSIGKTSTKFAVSQMLRPRYKVRFQEGNYNDVTTVPLIFFGTTLPSLLNPLAWLKVFISHEKAIAGNYGLDVVIVELGTDGPGQMRQFKRFLKADIGVLTSITPEHMEYFEDLDAVAREELTLVELCDELIVNIDMVDDTYLLPLKNNFASISLQKPATYAIERHKDNVVKVSFHDQTIKLTQNQSTTTQLYCYLAAVSVADKLGMKSAEIREGLKGIQPVNGRGTVLEGINGSMIIDETYNASPVAVKSALDVLYGHDAEQKIALLGNMNELGKMSEEAHREIGEYCDPERLAEVLTLGPDANEYLALTAEAKGCKVTRFDTPYKAGEYLKTILSPGTVVLAKGSQNNVYAEEAVKLLLANPGDSSKLVRQSSEWLRKKQKNFPKNI